VRVPRPPAARVRIRRRVLPPTELTQCRRRWTSRVRLVSGKSPRNAFAHVSRRDRFEFDGIEAAVVRQRELRRYHIPVGRVVSPDLRLVAGGRVRPRRGSSINSVCSPKNGGDSQKRAGADNDLANEPHYLHQRLQLRTLRRGGLTIDRCEDMDSQEQKIF
jgi:hypothetical protein